MVTQKQKRVTILLLSLFGQPLCVIRQEVSVYKTFFISYNIESSL